MLGEVSEKSPVRASKCAGPSGVLADHAVCDRDLGSILLAFLRHTLGRPQLSYREYPDIVAVGTEARIIGFELGGAPNEWRRPLILRISHDPAFPLHPSLEHAIQNAVWEQGFPAPKALLSSDSGAPLGRPFIIMERVGVKGPLVGRRFWKTRWSFFDKPSRKRPAQAIIPLTLACHMELLARLHSLDGRRLQKAFAARGINQNQWTESARFIHTKGIIEKANLEPMRPLMAWLCSHRPTLAGTSICHGDPHAGNVMTSEEGIVAMLDWGSGRLGYPESDLGVLCGYRRSLFDAFLSRPEHNRLDDDLLSVYETFRRCDRTLVRYFEAEMLVNLFASIGYQIRRRAAGLECPANPILDHPQTINRLSSRLRYLIGSDCPIPSRKSFAM
jgi:aminoglycoside phosphotransferase (APT) family kinase protein